MNLNSESPLFSNVQTKKIPIGGDHGNSQFTPTNGVHMYSSKSFDPNFKAKVDAFIQKIKSMTLNNSSHIVPSLLSEGKREGDEWVSINPTRVDQTKGSFKINLLSGIWSDFATGDKGGDFVSLVKYIKGIKPLEAANLLAAMMGEEVFKFGNNNNILIKNNKSSQLKPHEKLENSNHNFRPIFPLPEDAEKLNLLDLSSFSKVNGVKKIPNAAYEYRYSNGVLAFYVLRFDPENKKKYFQPVTFGINDSIIGWYTKCPLKNIPLYNLENIINNFEKEVLGMEGEKTAEAAIKLFGDRYCITTSAFGANGVNKTDFTPLTGRDVIILPDNDKAGRNYAQEFAKHAMAAGAKSVRIVQVPNEFPKGWDLADPLPEKFSLEDIGLLVESAEPFIPAKENKVHSENESAKSVKHPYRLTETHLEYFCISKKKSDDENPQEQWIPICDRLEIVACGRSSASDDWIKLLKFENREGITKTWPMPISMMAGDGREAIKVLHNLGLRIYFGKDKQLKAYLQDTEPTKMIRTFQQTGWQEIHTEKIYVTPNQIYGFANKEEFILDNLNAKHPFKTSGSLNDWQMQIARYAIGNSRFILALSAAFGPVFLYLMQIDSGGFHFRGGSSIGKTTLAYCAGSVWGGGGIKGYLRQWLATVNGLEAVSALHNDTLLCMDEIGQADGNDLGKIIYTLFNGEGKARMKDSIILRESHLWRLILISSGEISLANKIKEDSNGSKTTRAGMEVRLIDIPADCDKGFGVYEQLQEGFLNGAELSNHLSNASKQYYGTAIHEFLNELIKDIPFAIDFIENSMKKMKKCAESIADGQVGRIFDFFVFIASVGELAIKYKILPWLIGEAERGVIECFNAWLHNHGGSPEKTFEELTMLERVGEFFVRNQHSRFLNLGTEDNENDEYNSCSKQEFQRNAAEKNQNHAGYKTIKRNKNGEEERYFYLELKIFDSEICAGMDPKKVATILIRAGILEPDKSGSSQQAVWIRYNKKSERKYIFNSKVLEFGSTSNSTS